MAEPAQRLNFLGGMNRQPLQGEGQVKLLTNARPLVSGGLQVRYGQSLYASVGSDPTIGNVRYLFAYRTAALGTRLYSIRHTPTSNKFFDNTTEITGPTLVSSGYIDMVEGRGTIFLTNAETHNIQYHVPGTSVRAEITNSFAGEELPLCKFIQVYRNRLYAWTSKGLRYTNAGIYTTLPALHFADLNLVKVRAETVEPFGIGVGEDLLVMFTLDSYNIMMGVPGNEGARGSYTLKEYSGIGCGAPDTISSKGNMIIWIDTERRVRMLKGPVIHDLDPNDSVAEFLHAADNLETATARILGREIWVSLPKSGSAVDRRILVYDLFFEKWVAEFTGIEGYAIAYLPEINAVYVGAHTGGYIWRQANGNYKPLTDSGALIPFEWIDGQLVFGTLWHKKIFEKILVAYNLGASESLNFSYAINEIDSYTSFELNGTVTQPDSNWGSDNWGAATWGGNPGMESTVLRPKTKEKVHAYSMRLKVSGDLSGGTVIYGAKAYAEELERDGESGII